MGNFAENLNLGNRFRPPLHLQLASGCLIIQKKNVDIKF